LNTHHFLYIASATISASLLAIAVALWPRRFGVFGECIGNAKNNFFVTVQKVQHEHGGLVDLELEAVPVWSFCSLTSFAAGSK